MPNPTIEPYGRERELLLFVNNLYEIHHDPECAWILGGEERCIRWLDAVLPPEKDRG
jgi:hypothetical protein